MTVRKRYGKYYYTDFRVHGKRIIRKIPGGITNKDLAQQYTNDLKLKMLKGEIGITRNDYDLKSLVQEYLQFSKTNKAPASFYRDEVALRNFLTITGYNKLSEVTPRSLEKYKQTRLKMVSKRTVNLEITMLKAMLNKMVELEAIPKNPIKSVKKIRGPESKTLEFLTNDEIAALFQELTPTYYPVIYTFLKTGLRKSELVYLEWGDIDFDKKQIRVVNKVAHPTKSYKPRYIPMDNKLIEVLRAIKKMKSPYVFITARDTLRKNNLITNLKRTAKKAAIKKNVTIHMLRHTYASHLVMAGVDLATVKALLGHADIHTTMRYAHLAPDHLRQASNKLSF
jgi:integrase